MVVMYMTLSSSTVNLFHSSSWNRDFVLELNVCSSFVVGLEPDSLLSITGKIKSLGQIFVLRLNVFFGLGLVDVMADSLSANTVKDTVVSDHGAKDCL